MQNIIIIPWNSLCIHACDQQKRNKELDPFVKYCAVIIRWFCNSKPSPLDYIYYALISSLWVPSVVHKYIKAMNGKKERKKKHTTRDKIEACAL